MTRCPIVVRSAWLAWALFLAAITVAVICDPTGRTVTPNYRNASFNWFAGLPLYEDGVHGFLYFPQAAVLFAPFTYFGSPWGDVTWRVMGISSLALAIWRLVLLVGQRRQPAAFLLATLTAVPPALASARNGQMNLLLTSLITLAFLALAARQRRAAAAWLCLGVALKPLMALPMAMAIAIDRRLAPALLVGLVIVAAVPFLLQDPHYVWQQYGECLSKLFRAGVPGTANPHADLFGMLASFGWTVPVYVQTPVRALVAALVVCLCRMARRRMNTAHWALWVLTLTAGCLAVINPRMENNGYVLLAPSLGGLAALAWTSRPRRPTTGLLVAIAAVGIAGSYELTRGPNFWACPFFTCLLMCHIVARLGTAGRRQPVSATALELVTSQGAVRRSVQADHDLTVIIPALNESSRLPRTLIGLKSYLEAWGIDYRVLVVDDGSADGTSLVAGEFGPRFDTLRLPTQRGKGAAVRTGMRVATGRVVAFTDADLPYELDALRTGYEWIESGDGEAVFGARDIPGAATRVPRRPLRTVASLFFRCLTQRLISREVTDTQCGLKVFSLRAARAIFGRTLIDGFAFDAEVVWVCLQLGLACRRVPVTLANEYGSTLSISRHAWRMCWDLWWLRRMHRAGRGIINRRAAHEQPLASYTHREKAA